MPRAQYRYLCPACGAWHWSITYRKSLVRDCPLCYQRGRHYRDGTLEALKAKRLVDATLTETHSTTPKP